MPTPKFLLPPLYKWPGLILFLLSLIVILVSKIFPGWFFSIWPGSKLILYALLCLGLLVIILSKEKVEDEFIQQIRLESFCFAIILGVSFGILGIVVEQFFPKVMQTSVDLLLLQLLGYNFWFQLKLFKAK